MSTKQLNVIIDLQTKNAKAIARLEKDIRGLTNTSKTGGISFGKLVGAFTAGNIISNTLSATFGRVTNALGGLVQQADGMIQQSAEMQKSLTTLSILSERYGVAQDDATAAAERLGRELRIGTGPAAESLQRLFKSGLNLEQAEELLRRFTNEAITGKQPTMELGDAVQNLASGYQMEMSALMDRAGISENISTLMQKEADLQGVQIANLDEAAKNQLKYNAFIRLTNETMGAAEKFQGTYIDKQAQIEQKINETRVAIGNILMPLAEMRQQGFILLGDALTGVAGKQDEARDSLINLRDSIIEATMKVFDMEGGAGSLQQKLNDFVTQTLERLITFINEFATAIQSSEAELNALRDIYVYEVRPALAELAEQFGLGSTSASSMASDVLTIVGGLLKLISVTAQAITKLQQMISVMQKVSRVYMGIQTLGISEVTRKDGIFRNRGGMVTPVYANNGFMNRRGTDSVPAMLTPGERVLSVDQNRNFEKLLKNAVSNRGVTITVTGNTIDSSSRVDEIVNRVKQELGGFNKLANYGYLS